MKKNRKSAKRAVAPRRSLVRNNDSSLDISTILMVGVPVALGLTGAALMYYKQSGEESTMKEKKNVKSANRKTEKRNTEEPTKEENSTEVRDIKNIERDIANEEKRLDDNIIPLGRQLKGKEEDDYIKLINGYGTLLGMGKDNISDLGYKSARDKCREIRNHVIKSVRNNDSKILGGIIERITNLKKEHVIAQEEEIKSRTLCMDSHGIGRIIYDNPFSKNIYDFVKEEIYGYSKEIEIDENFEYSDGIKGYLIEMNIEDVYVYDDNIKSIKDIKNNVMPGIISQIISYIINNRGGEAKVNIFLNYLFNRLEVIIKKKRSILKYDGMEVLMEKEKYNEDISDVAAIYTAIIRPFEGHSKGMDIIYKQLRTLSFNIRRVSELDIAIEIIRARIYGGELAKSDTQKEKETRNKLYNERDEVSRLVRIGGTCTVPPKMDIDVEYKTYLTNKTHNHTTV